VFVFKSSPLACDEGCTMRSTCHLSPITYLKSHGLCKKYRIQKHHLQWLVTLLLPLIFNLSKIAVNDKRWESLSWERRCVFWIFCRVLLQKPAVTLLARNTSLLSCNPKVHQRVHSAPLHPRMSQLNPVCTLTACFLRSMSVAFSDLRWVPSGFV
jgi:hypothetical protein